MSEVPDHLIEKAAKALAKHDDWSVDDWDDWDDYDRYSYMRHARAALEAVAGELRAEGARAEREKIAAWLDDEADAAVVLRFDDGHERDPRPMLSRLARRVREGGDTGAQ